jgi:hypothetical protein
MDDRSNRETDLSRLAKGEPPAHLVSELAVATDHAAKGRVIVAQQRLRVERLAGLGRLTERSEQLLDTFLLTQLCLEDHERHLREEVEAATR